MQYQIILAIPPKFCYAFIMGDKRLLFQTKIFGIRHISMYLTRTYWLVTSYYSDGSVETTEEPDFPIITQPLGVD